MKIYIILLALFSSLSLTAQQNVLDQILNDHPEYFGDILDKSDSHFAQIIYTQINRDANNQPTFKTYTHGITDEYYYPASTVKMPAAFLALEKLNNLGLDKNLQMYTGAGHFPQTTVLEDPSAPDEIPTIAHYIKHIFLVSDNDAYNRLYEFLGQAYFNQKLKEKGLDQTRIIHRLSIGGFDREKNSWTNPVSLFDDKKMVYQQGEVYSRFDWDFNIKNEIRGVAHLGADNKIIPEPFNFSEKNYVSLMDLHDMLKVVMLPEGVAPDERFDLTESDYDFLYEWMSKLPRASDYPKHDEPDNYVKFYVGVDTSATIPPHIKIFNKVGWAYGYLTDVSYIIDTQNKVEYLLAANIHVNANQTYNDGVYEYESIGLPFFANLGKVIHDYELKRKRKYQPDLSRYIK
ncbi:MAG: serine hydrolase [Saprospiraceae bacterium]